MEYNFCYILDYSDCSIHCLHLNNAEKKVDDFETMDELISYWGFNPDECSWMFVENRKELNDIIIPLKN